MTQSAKPVSSSLPPPHLHLSPSSFPCLWQRISAGRGHYIPLRAILVSRVFKPPPLVPQTGPVTGPEPGNPCLTIATVITHDKVTHPTAVSSILRQRLSSSPDAACFRLIHIRLSSLGNLPNPLLSTDGLYEQSCPEYQESKGPKPSITSLSSVCPSLGSISTVFLNYRFTFYSSSSWSSFCGGRGQLGFGQVRSRSRPTHQLGGRRCPPPPCSMLWGQRSGSAAAH